MERPCFASVEAYRPRFTDAAYWRPYVAAICARHGLPPCRDVRAGLPGTHPVFIVDDRYAVKLFTDLFDGAHSFAVEMDLYSLLTTAPQIPAPTLLAQGRLFPEGEGWSWPYLITSVIPGTSLGEVAAGVSYGDKEALASYLGGVARHLHTLPVERSRSLPRSWDAFERLLQARRAACAADYAGEGAMPRHLIAELDAYLPPLQTLVDRAAQPYLLHGDLNEDHVLGRFEGQRWRPTGIIDFGDVKVGDPLYELVALHIGLFHCDKRLLRVFLDSYGLNPRGRFVTRAMDFTLLHEFTVLSPVFTEFPAAREVGDLSELATLIWDLEQPGLPG